MFHKLMKKFKKLFIPEKFKCPKCGGKVFFSGERYKDYPQSYGHKCSNCDYFSGAGVYTIQNKRKRNNVT